MPAAMIATSKMMYLTRPPIQPPQYAPESRDVINPAACRDRQGCGRAAAMVKTIAVVFDLVEPVGAGWDNRTQIALLDRPLHAIMRIKASPSGGAGGLRATG
jgi:hypothetical protein